MDKKIILLGIAAVCVGLYFYGSQIGKDNNYLKYLPVIGGGAYAIKFITDLAIQ